MRAIYRKIRHARYLYIKRNVEKDSGARYILGARYLSKYTVCTFYECNGFCKNANYLSFPYEVSCEVADSARSIYRKMRHARYLYIKRNVENVWGTRYTLVARYLSKNTVCTFYEYNGFCKNANYLSFPYEVCCEVADSAVFFGAELYTLPDVNPEVSVEAAARYLPEWF